MPDWLSLDEAAKRLNVHPTTLREWADKGRIRVFRTPGGHRRFSEADVSEMGAQPKPDLSLLMHATVGQTRLATNDGRLALQSWYARFDEEAKARQRELGMDLVQFLVSRGQREKAEGEVAKAEQKLPADQTNLTLAQCYEALGRRDRAQELYQAALSANLALLSTGRL